MQRNNLQGLRLSEQLQTRQSQNLFREQEAFQRINENELLLGEDRLIDFASNDYLGLSIHERAKQAIAQSVQSFGFGSAGSHLISGHSIAHEQLNLGLAQFLQREKAITFSCGYMANLAILQALAKRGDLIIADKLNHASLIDGAQLSSADTCRYSHVDLLSLEHRLKKSANNKFVVTDSVFSMDGDIAPLVEIVELCEKYQAFLVVDDAHGFGVLGENGRGVCEYFNLSEKQVPVLMTTLGKALGGVGACVSGKRELVEYLIQFARPYIYTTAMPAICAVGNLANLSVLESEPEKVESLRKNIADFRLLCAQQNLPLNDSLTAIQPIMVENDDKVMRIKKHLIKQGFLIGAIRPPTVPVNSARLRVSIKSTHQRQQLQRLVKTIVEALAIKACD